MFIFKVWEKMTTVKMYGRSIKNLESFRTFTLDETPNLVPSGFVIERASAETVTLKWS